MNAQGSDSRIMYSGSVDLRLLYQAREHFSIACGLRKQHYARRVEPRIYLLKSFRRGRGWGINPVMRDDCQELVDAGPRNGPGWHAFG